MYNGEAQRVPTRVISEAQGDRDLELALIPNEHLRTLENQVEHLRNLLEDLPTLSRVLVNLVSNAINYTEAGRGIEISTGREGDNLPMTVTDQGMGVRADDLPHIFDRFYRTREAQRLQTGGTGLGLAICKEIVELHGGALRVVSTPGEGSTFTLSLPIGG